MGTIQNEEIIEFVLFTHFFSTLDLEDQSQATEFMNMRLTLLAVSAGCLFVQAVSAETFTADVWSDNWFQFNVNGVMVAEDSVSITTERSFNAENFTFDSETPFTIGLIAKDFKENDTGLEYIGTRKQQMGDGGVIVQVSNSKGEVVAVTDAAWRCLVIHEAPLDKRCEDESNPVAGEGYCDFIDLEEPAGWDLPDFDDSGWTNADVYSESAVSPKQGYDRVSWNSDAKLIWGPDLETNNTLLCRLSVN